VEKRSKKKTLTDPPLLLLKSLFRTARQHTQTPRIATLNVTNTNIEHHAKTAKTDTKTPVKNPNRA
jgi:hypothetical protein